jgi:tRNA 2-thiouridine synthesizing protein B
MSHILHLVNKSPTDRNAFDTCFRMASPGDSILLIEDGVYAALANAEFADKITSRLDNFSFYVLGPDVAARGLGDTPLIEDIGVVDYDGFVDLVAENDITQSWL